MCAIYLNMHINIIKLKYCWAYSTHHNTSLIHSFMHSAAILIAFYVL